MASLITSCFCERYSSMGYKDCHKASPVIDIIGGLALLILGTYIAAYGPLTGSPAALCGAFAGGAFLLGSGLSTFAQWIWNPCCRA